jgi:uncharacterized FAD-dependent dehydrogenase
MKKYLLRNLIVPLEANPDLKAQTSRKLQIHPNRIESLTVNRRSLDARKKNNLKYNYTLELEFNTPPTSHPDLAELVCKEEMLFNPVPLSSAHPIIIGAGPAGLFAALALVEKGFSPLVFDQGEQISERKSKVQDFWKNGILDPDSNVQFGEGGAGTFSDGKLTARSRDKTTDIIFNYLIQFGANPDILIDSLPHLGTDTLESIITNLRIFLEKHGCQFLWKHKLKAIEIGDNRIKSVRINDNIYHPEITILAPGNSARDTFALLHSSSVPLESKDFAIGFRIEHTQEYINSTFYGEKTDFSLTGPATYRLVRNLEQRSVFSFCMCPGGQVVNGASEAGGVVTNGMSNSKRSSRFANSALVTGVSSKDFGTDLFAGVRFQQKLEKEAYRDRFTAPAQSAKDFVGNTLAKHVIKTSFLPETYACNLNNLFSLAVSTALKTALSHWERQFPGFVKEGNIIAPETRTSSPIRIIRDIYSRHSINIKNLYPIGEGAGYAGGIVSSAADGWKTGSLFVLKK